MLQENDECRVIGIDGGWGSGKSNVIKLVEKGCSNKSTHFFIYDAWGHQEDLQRRAFLEELTDQLIRDKVLPDRWKDELKKLMAKKKETVTRSVPGISVGIILVAFSVILAPVLKAISDLASGYLIQYIILCIPLFFLMTTYLITLFKIRGVDFWSKFGEAFKRLFIQYKNNGEEETRFETISEDEPTVKQFRQWMSSISSDMGEKMLVLVFDNMDRLPSEKVRELWSSIHVFFAETRYNNIRVVIPFDRIHIRNAFGQANVAAPLKIADDFIDKTFNVVFRVAPPILTDWKDYFLFQWRNAFGDDTSSDDLSNIIQLFDRMTLEVTPRRIIAFVNEFVAIKMTLRGNIPDKYIGAFIAGKTAISENPTREILEPSFLGNLQFLFSSDQELSKYLAALFYQLDPDKAVHVVFSDRLRKSLDNNNLSEIKAVCKIPEFALILGNAVTLVNNYENAVLALDAVEQEFGNDIKIEQLVWECLYNKVQSKPNCRIHKYQLILIKKIKNKERYLDFLIADLTNDQGFTAIAYRKSIDLLGDELGDRDMVLKKLPLKDTGINDFIGFVTEVRDEFKNYNVKTDNAALNSYLNSKEILSLGNIEFIPYLAKEFDLRPFVKKVEELIGNYGSTENVDFLSILFARYKEAADKSVPLPVKLPDSVVLSLFRKLKRDQTFFIDILAMLLTRLDKIPTRDSFGELGKVLNASDAELAVKVGMEIQYYTDFNSFILRTERLSKHQLYLDVARGLMYSSTSKSTASLIPLLQSFSKIQKILGISPENILKGLDAVERKSLTRETISVVINTDILKECLVSDTSLARDIIIIYKEFLDSFDENEWDKYYRSDHIKMSLLIDYIFGENALRGMIKLLASIADRKLDSFLCDQNTMNQIVHKMYDGGLNVQNAFVQVRDIICDRGNITPLLFNFFGDWLIDFGEISKRPDAFKKIFPTQVLKNEECLKILLRHKGQIYQMSKTVGNDIEKFKNTILELIASNNNPDYAIFKEMF